MNYGLISNVGYHANQLTNNRILEEISDEENGIYSIEWGKGPSFSVSPAVGVVLTWTQYQFKTN